MSFSCCNFPTVGQCILNLQKQDCVKRQNESHKKEANSEKIQTVLVWKLGLYSIAILSCSFLTYVS